ncbi:MAG: hypothetical protein GSR79_01685 [Desulfurococcales archaeon]|nr:hypothetical protein [Desulfurococcales archaeon]
MPSNVERLGKALIEFESELDKVRDELDAIANDLLVIAEELVAEIRNESISAYEMARDKVMVALEEEVGKLRESYNEKIQKEVSRLEGIGEEKYEEAIELALEMIRGAVA